LAAIGEQCAEQPATLVALTSKMRLSTAALCWLTYAVLQREKVGVIFFHQQCNEQAHCVQGLQWVFMH
jgi:hypothetical protein